MVLMVQVENILSTYEPHACVVVYSIVDRWPSQDHFNLFFCQQEQIFAQIRLNKSAAIWEVAFLWWKFCYFWDQRLQSIQLRSGVWRINRSWMNLNFWKCLQNNLLKLQALQNLIVTGWHMMCYNPQGHLYQRLIELLRLIKLTLHELIELNLQSNSISGPCFINQQFNSSYFCWQ